MCVSVSVSVSVSVCACVSVCVRARAWCAGQVYLDGELFQPADPDGSMDLNGILTGRATGEWVGLTWSVRKRTPCKVLSSSLCYCLLDALSDSLCHYSGRIRSSCVRA